MRKTLWAGAAVLFVVVTGGGCVIEENAASGGTTSSAPSTGTNYTTTTSSTYSSSSTVQPSTGAVMPMSCTADPMDDQCTACEKQSCCNEIMACDADASCWNSY